MKLYYITCYDRSRSLNDYIEADNLIEALRKFHKLHQVSAEYNSLSIKRIYRQMQIRHTIEQIARRNTYIIKQMKQQPYED